MKAAAASKIIADTQFSAKAVDNPARLLSLALLVLETVFFSFLAGAAFKHK